ncbi:MAG: hypothetical protein LC641_10865 [Spirochaeta sp.]|nr:hypothetical protein [Spirochaeta sp.]
MHRARNLQEELPKLLSALTRAGLGKRTRSDLYAHRSLVDIYAADICPELLNRLDLLWRGWAPAGIDPWNILRISARADACAQLCYPRFDDTGHPAIAASLKTNFSDTDTPSGTVTPSRTEPSFTDYRGRNNPPILHRKELLVAPAYPHAGAFSALTQAELAAGLLHHAHTVGYRRQWEARLSAAGLAVQGHQLGEVPRSVH